LEKWTLEVERGPGERAARPYSPRVRRSEKRQRTREVSGVLKKVAILRERHCRGSVLMGVAKERGRDK